MCKSEVSLKSEKKKKKVPKPLAALRHCIQIAQLIQIWCHILNVFQDFTPFPSSESDWLGRGHLIGPLDGFFFFSPPALNRLPH